MKTVFDKYGIQSVQDLMDFLSKNMHYGFKYKNKIFTDYQPDFQENMDKFYKIRLGEDFIKSGYGVCWDFCELEREFFLSKNIEHECFFLDSFIDVNLSPTHTFALFKQGGKWCWFEYSWAYYRGIWQYETKEAALKDILKKHNKFFDNKIVSIDLYKTEKVTKRMDTFEFCQHCLNGEKIDLEEDYKE